MALIRESAIVDWWEKLALFTWKLQSPLGRVAGCVLKYTKGSCLSKFYYQTDVQENCVQRSIKIYIKITIAAACFGVITIISERAVWACWSYNVKTVG